MRLTDRIGAQEVFFAQSSRGLWMSLSLPILEIGKMLTTRPTPHLEPVEGLEPEVIRPLSLAALRPD